MSAAQPDRRRANRVQGGFNRAQGPSSCQPRRPAPDKGPMPFAPDSKRPWTASTASNPSVSRQGPWGNPSSSLGHSLLEKPLIFQESDGQETREKPEKITISQEGEHELSVEPSGRSWISFYPGFLNEAMEKEACELLLNEIKWERTSIIVAGQSYYSPRLVKWYGPLPYSYSSLTLEADNEWHPAVKLIWDEVRNKLPESDFNSVLLNLYEFEKHSVDWHSDNELSMGVLPTIASVSLGEARKFELRKKPPPSDGWNYDYMQHVELTLPGGSLLVMDGATQKDWQHRVPKEYHSRRPRINLTFRTIYHTMQKPHE